MHSIVVVLACMRIVQKNVLCIIAVNRMHIYIRIGIGIDENDRNRGVILHNSTGCPILDRFRHGHFPQQPRVPDPPQRHRPTSIYPYVNTLPARGTSPTTSSALRLGLLLVRLVRSGVAERNGPNSAFWPAHWCCRTPRNL